MKDDHPILPVAALLLTIFLWGISFVMTKALLGYMDPALFIPSRFFLGALIFLPFQWGKGFPERSQLFQLLAISLFQPGLYFLGETLGIQYLGASLSSLLIGTIPLFTALGAWAAFGEKPAGPFWTGFLISLAGLFLLFFPLPIPTEDALLGFGAIVLAILAAAFYMILTKRMSGKLRAVQITFWQFVFGFFFFLPWPLVTGPALPENILEPATILIILAIGPTAGAFLFYNYALSKMSAGRASLGLNLIPLVTIITGMIFLGEAWNLRQLLGGIILIGGLILGSLKNYPLKKPLPR